MGNVDNNLKARDFKFILEDLIHTKRFKGMDYMIVDIKYSNSLGGWASDSSDSYDGVICIPSGEFEYRDFITCHELTHIKYRDYNWRIIHSLLVYISIVFTSICLEALLLNQIFFSLAFVLCIKFSRNIVNIYHELRADKNATLALLELGQEIDPYKLWSTVQNSENGLEFTKPKLAFFFIQMFFESISHPPIFIRLYQTINILNKVKEVKNA